MKQSAPLRERVALALTKAGSSGLTMQELACAVYGEDGGPTEAGASIRAKIAIHNAQTTDNRIVCRGMGYKARWYIGSFAPPAHTDEDAPAPVESGTSRKLPTRMFERAPVRSTRPRVPVDVMARFAPGCTPRYGR